MVIAVEYMREIINVFDKAERIKVFSEGEATTYNCGTDEYKGITECWYEMIANAYEMPAFGVSLNNETVKALKSGRWIEFDFGKRLEINGMPFEKLLIQVESNYKGFNLIRYTKERGYDGRCFYLNLVDNDMLKLSEYLAFLAQNTAI